MIIYLKSRTKKYDAKAEYNKNDGKVVVFKGSTISDTVSQGSFRSAKSVETLRKSGCVKNNKLVEDVSFKSASSAANFVTGSSTNGKLAWKDENGTALKDLV